MGGKESRPTARSSSLQGDVESVKFMTASEGRAYEAAAWDDSNNNRAFLSQTISATLNGASIYIASLRNPDRYITEKGAQ